MLVGEASCQVEAEEKKAESSFDLFTKGLKACICLTRKCYFYTDNSICIDLGVNNTQTDTSAIA